MAVNCSQAKEFGVRFSDPAKHAAYRSFIAPVLLAALPLTLGLLHDAVFLKAAVPAVPPGQNAAETALPLGNQPIEPALANGADAMRGAMGDVLALCSGISGATPGARPNCTALAFTIQR